MAVPEARLEASEGGLVAKTEGWFAVNIRDTAWMTNPVLGDVCIFSESDDVSFPELGYTIAVLAPGQSGGRYHREDNQEDFLVLQGECIALIEGEERLLRAWEQETDQPREAYAPHPPWKLGRPESFDGLPWG